MTGHQQSLFDIMNDEQPAPEQEKNIPPPAVEDKIHLLEQYKAQCIKCRRCELRSGCRQVVFGVGDPCASLMLVGEGPGADEDRLGEPFVGRAGQLLDRILAAVGLAREEVYIANVVKCRPPGNRLPFQGEVDACLSHLLEQIRLVDPQIILCLGALATRTLMDKHAAITRYRGQWLEREGRRYLATFHPAALLRDPGKKKDVWEDFKQMQKVYKQPVGG